VIDGSALKPHPSGVIGGLARIAVGGECRLGGAQLLRERDGFRVSGWARDPTRLR
jgi:hypothetical protein